MKSLNMFINLLCTNQLLDEKFISLLIGEYIETYNLDLYSIEFTNDPGIIAAYGNGKIYINYENVVRSSVSYLNLDKDLTSSDFTRLNLDIMRIIFHELTHVMQHDKNNIGFEIFERVFYFIKHNYDVYLNNHDTMLIEYNANTHAAFLTDEFTDKAFEMILGMENDCLYDEIIQMYLRGYSKTSPLTEYNKLTKQNIDMLTTISPYDKFNLGMPLTFREREAIENLCIIKKDNNVKDYLKNL